MHSTKLFSAILAAGAAVVSATDCSKDITITETNQAISCDTISANVKVDEHLAGDLVIEGPKEIDGDLIIVKASNLTSFSSSTLTTITGTFQLDALESLESINLGAIRSLNDINFNNLARLNSLVLGSSGLTKAGSISVTDTFLHDLDQLNVATVDSFVITNNKGLTSFDSDLVNITDKLIISSNGIEPNEMTVTMNHLESAGELQISDVKTLEVPLLEKITKNIKFDSNQEMTSFAAPNLTETTDDVSFINNNKLKNISMPLLTSVAGLTILNNSALTAVEGFPKLETVTGAILLGGEFEKVELPKLKDVKGSVTVTSTTDISSFCDFFDQAKADGDIQGKESCTSKNKNANTGGDGGVQSDGSGSSGSDNQDDAAGIISVNTGLLGLALVAGIAQLL